jgi:hypothetical protein
MPHVAPATRAHAILTAVGMETEVTVPRRNPSLLVSVLRTVPSALDMTTWASRLVRSQTLVGDGIRTAVGDASCSLMLMLPGPDWKMDASESALLEMSPTKAWPPGLPASVRRKPLSGALLTSSRTKGALLAMMAMSSWAGRVANL